MAFDIYTLIEAAWLIIPAYAANGLAPLARGKRPIDGGRKFGRGPLLGQGKTWEGTVLGIVAAGVVAVFMQFMRPLIPFEVSAVPLLIVPMGIGFGILLGIGAMVGDIVESFAKRRAGIARGRPLPVLDQIDFVLGALVFAMAAGPVRWEWVIWLLVLTPMVHYFANGVAYAIGLKKGPW